MDMEENLMGSYEDLDEDTGQTGSTVTQDMDTIDGEAVVRVESKTHIDTEESLMENYEDNRQNGAPVAPDMDTIMEFVAGIPGEILPGIPFDVTLNLVTPKLSWMHCFPLFQQSRQGQEALRSRLVYDMRVRRNCTESLAIFSQSLPRLLYTLSSLRGESPPYVQYERTLTAYSLRDKLFYHLPPIPGCHGGIPRYCQVQSVEGRLYVLGGNKALDDDVAGSKDVYMMDLAGQVEWMVCARMRKSRTQFTSAVVNGKIYVFGGTSYENASLKCEVYDPKVNAWSWIKPMPRFRRRHQIQTAGDELFIYRKRYRYWEAEVYHTVNDEWRVTNDYFYPPPDSVAVHGRYLEVRGGQIWGLAVESGRIVFFQKYSYGTKWEGGDYLCDGGDDGNGIAVADELLVLQKCDRNGPGLRLLQSSGFGHGCKKDLVWSEISQVPDDCRMLCCVEL